MRCRFNPWIRKIPLEKGMAAHPSILAWRIPRTEEPHELQSLGFTNSRTWLSDFHFSASSRGRFIDTSFTLLTKTAKKKKLRQNTWHISFQVIRQQRTVASESWRTKAMRLTGATSQRAERAPGCGTEKRTPEPRKGSWKSKEAKQLGLQGGSPGGELHRGRALRTFERPLSTHQSADHTWGWQTDYSRSESDLDLVSRRDHCWHRARNSTSWF